MRPRARPHRATDRRNGGERRYNACFGGFAAAARLCGGKRRMPQNSAFRGVRPLGQCYRAGRAGRRIAALLLRICAAVGGGAVEGAQGGSAFVRPRARPCGQLVCSAATSVASSSSIVCARSVRISICSCTFSFSFTGEPLFLYFPSIIYCVHPSPEHIPYKLISCDVHSCAQPPKPIIFRDR